MKSGVQQNHTRYYCALIICHGKSEWILFDKIKATFRIPVCIVGENSGRKSIQVGSLMKYLGKSPYDTLIHFLKDPKVEGRIHLAAKTFKGFRIFPVMDLDDCDNEEMKKRYIDGSMFQDHWMAPYITPIFFKENLDESFLKRRYGVDTDHKTSSYEAISKKITISVDALSKTSDAFRGASDTNLSVLLDYLIDNIQ